MAATIVQSKTAAVNVGDASPDPAFDNPTAAGSVVVMMVGSDDYDTGTPSGFTLSTGCAQETFLGAYLWWKVSSGGETTFTYSIGSASPSCWILLEISGLDATPYDTSNGQFVQSSSLSITTPAITPSTGDRFLLAMVGFSSSNAFTAPPNGVGSWLNSFTEITEICTVLGSGTRDQIGVAYREVTGDGSTTFSSGATSAGSGTPQSRAGIIIAFEVAAGGGTVTGAADRATTFSATVAGTRKVLGAAARETTFGTTVAGTRTVSGTAARSTTFSTSAAGTRTVLGAAARATTFAAPALGAGQAETVTGTAATEVTFAAGATGTRTVGGVVARATTFAAAATGTRIVLGAAALAGTFAAAAVGSRTVLGAAGIVVTFTGTAVVEADQIKATSSATVTAARTSSPAVTARRTSTAAVTAAATSTATVG